MESIAAYHERKRYDKKFQDHRRDPAKHPEPVLFNHVRRYVYVI